MRIRMRACGELGCERCEHVEFDWQGASPHVRWPDATRLPAGGHAGGHRPFAAAVDGSGSAGRRRQGARRSRRDHDLQPRRSQPARYVRSEARGALPRSAGHSSAIRTASPEIQITEILPLHAKHADKFSLVRSCYHTAAAVHDTGHQMMQTGRLFTGGVNTPHAGCALAYLRGRKSDLPAPRRPARADGPHRRQPAARPGRRLPGQGARSVRLDGRSLEAGLPRAGLAAAAADRRGAPRSPPPAAGNRRRDGEELRSLSRRAAAGQQLRSGLPPDDQHAGPRGVRSLEGAASSSRALRHDALRPMLPAGAAADRGGRAVRHRQHVPDGVRRDHLGHPRLEAFHVDRGHAGHRGPDVRPGLQRAAGGPCPIAACWPTRWCATWRSSAARRA